MEKEKVMVRNILLTIEYDGTDFSGWQIQPDARTVQGELQKAVNKICGKKENAENKQDFKLDGTSRTDTGVHAYGQRASFKGEFGIPTGKIREVLNNLLPEDIKICDVKEVELEFHARYSAKGKKYIYKIMNDTQKDVFRRNYFYFVKKPLNIERMIEAAQYFTGAHDFAAFMAMGSTPQKTTVRTVYSCKVIKNKQNPNSEEIDIEIKGDGFLYNMVRIIAGTLVDIGLGKLSPENIPEIIESGNRSRAGHTAPPQGLYLAEIYYSNEELERA